MMEANVHIPDKVRYVREGFTVTPAANGGYVVEVGARWHDPAALRELVAFSNWRNMRDWLDSAYKLSLEPAYAEAPLKARATP